MSSASPNMMSADAPGTIYRWIEKKPLTEAVSWTSREKFWLFIAVYHYGTHDWKSVSQVVKNAGEQYRPKDWYTPKSIERQFKIIVSSQSEEVKSLPLDEMVRHIAENFKNDYNQDISKSNDSLKTKYCGLFSILDRMKQGNLSRNEVISLYSQAKRNENEDKQYVEQLMTMQYASLASENSSSGLSEEIIKWNTPSAPLLTSLLRSRNTIPATRTVTTITSLLQSPGGTSRTRSGKMLPLSSSVKTTSAQGTPTLSKLLEAPANPYLSSPPQSTQKNKQSEVVGTDKLVGNTSRKENSLPTSLNKVWGDNVNTSGSSNQINKSDLSASKKQSPKSPVSAVKNGSKVTSNIISLISDSDNDEDSEIPVLNTNLKEKKDTSIISKIEPRATRSQTRAEGNSFKQLNDTKMYDEKKEQQILQQKSEVSQLTETNHFIEDDIIDIDKIEVEPLSMVQNEITPRSKVTRSSVQRSLLNTATENLLPNKVKSKEISNQMLEEISANFVLNSTVKNVATEYKNVMVGRSRIDSSNLSRCIVPIGGSTVNDAIILRKDGQSFPAPVNMLTTFDGKILKQNRIFDLKGTNLKCIDGKVFTNPVVVLKKPFNIKLAPELKNKTDDIQLKNNDPKKTIKLNNSSQNLVNLLDGHHSFSNDDISFEDDVVIDVDSGTTKTKKLSSKVAGLPNLPLTVVSSKDRPDTSGILKPSSVQLNEKRTKTLFNVFGKPQTISNIPSKLSSNQDSASKVEISSNMRESNNHYIKELEFDFDQSITQNSLSNLYHGVGEIVEMNPFDNEVLNSLIQCTSLDNSETEEPQNVTNVDYGDSSLSGSDSTIGAFDTFAQITRVLPKPSEDTSNHILRIKQEKLDPSYDGVSDFQAEGTFNQSNFIFDLSGCNTIPVSAPTIPITEIAKSKMMNEAILSQINLNDDEVTTNAVDTVETILLSDDENDDEMPEPSTLTEEVSEPIKKVENHPLAKRMRYEVFSFQQRQAVDNGMPGITDLQIIPEINMQPVDISVRAIAFQKFMGAKTRRACGKNNSLSRNQLDKSAASSSKESDKVRKGNEVKELMNTQKDLDKKNKKEADNKETSLRISNANRGTLKIVHESKEKLQIEAIEKNKKEQVMKEKDVEVLLEEKKEFVTEIINKAKQVEKNGFEAEIMQRAKKTQIKNSKGPEMSKLKEAEMFEEKEIEIKNAKEIQIKRAKEIQINRAKEIQINRAKEIQIKRAKELLEQRNAKENEMKKAKEIEMKKAKEIEMKKAKEIEMKKAKEIEMKKAKEIEMKKAKEIEMKKAKEIEMKKAKEIEMKKAKEIEMKKAKEIEMKKAEEIEMKKAKEIEMKKAKEIEMKAKEIEMKKAEEIEMKKAEEIEMKKAKEIEMKKAKEKELEMKKAKELEILKEIEMKKAKEKELEMKKAKELEILKEIEMKKAKEKELEMKKAKELEILKEIEMKKAKEIETMELKMIEERKAAAKKAQEIELHKAKEARIQCIKDAEIHQAEISRKVKEAELLKEAEIKKAEEEEIKKAEEEEIKKAEEEEIKKAEEEEIKKAEEEIKKAEEEKIKKAEEEEIKKAEEEEIKKAEEEKIKKAEEEEIKKAEEEEIKKAEEEEIKKAEEEEIKKAEEEIKKSEEEIKKAEEEIKKAEEEEIEKAEEEIKKAEEEEIKKAEEEIKKADLKRKKEDITKDDVVLLKKAKEAEIKNVLEDAEIKAKEADEFKETKNIEIKEKEEKLSKTKEVELKKVKELKSKDIQSVKLKDLKIGMLQVKVHLQRQELSDQSKKINNPERIANETNKTNVKETEIKEFDKEVSKSKEQGLKKSLEEVKKFKDVENKINTRTRGLKIDEKLKDISKNISVKSASSVKPLDSSPSSSSSTNEIAKNMYDGNKHNDNINKCDKDMNPSECIKHGISGKSRTRSSLTKQSTNFEKLSTSVVHNIYGDCEVVMNDILETSCEEVKMKHSINSLNDVPSSSINQKHSAELSKGLDQSNFDKDVSITLKHLPVVFPMKKPVIYIAKYDEPVQGMIGNDQKLEKPPPKKRGRKRRIDIEMSNSDKPSIHNGVTTIIQDMEPLAKRTRRSVEMPLLAKRTRKTVDTCESENKTVVKSLDKTFIKKELLEYFNKCICDNKKYLKLFEKVVKCSSPMQANINKHPILLKDIKRKINSGESTSIVDLEYDFAVMAINAIMVIKQRKLLDKANNYMLDEFIKFEKSDSNPPVNDSDVSHGKSEDLYGINVTDVTISNDNVKSCNNAGPGRRGRMKRTKTYNRFTRSNKESSSDSESDKALPYKKRRIAYNFTNDEDRYELFENDYV